MTEPPEVKNPMHRCTGPSGRDVRLDTHVWSVLYETDMALPLRPSPFLNRIALEF